MFCRNCGAAIPEEGAFCEKCGTPVAIQKSDPIKETEEKTKKPEKTKAKKIKPEKTKAEKTKTEKIKPEKTKTEKIKPEKTKAEKTKAEKKKSAQPKFGFTVLSVILCILVILTGSLANIIFLARHALSEESIENLVKDFDLSDLKMGFTGEEFSSLTLSEYIVENQNSLYMPDIQEEEIEELLQEKFIQKFLSKKAKAYIEDLFYDTGEGIIKAKELQKLWMDNADKIYEITRTRWSEQELRLTLERMEEEGFLDVLDLSIYRDQNPGPFLLVKYLLSYWMCIALLIVAILLSVSIFLLQKRNCRGLSFMGSTFIVIGIFNLLAGILGNTFSSLLNRRISLGHSFWKLIFGSIRTTEFITAAVLISSGIIFWAAYILIKHIQMKKTSQ